MQHTLHLLGSFNLPAARVGNVLRPFLVPVVFFFIVYVRYMYMYMRAYHVGCPIVYLGGGLFMYNGVLFGRELCT